ncbi:iron-sulfur cluster assembly scaffold protein [Chlorobium phaeovibrioides]|uniref:Iron-sulfur cluster assembly scaffold protein n=2 Tax=Chlorobium phaeovibrioides TaxID=1094 RepID=A0A432AUB0_CHLPH|nr:iron-sulfur cluster assembly scaffold protein [Chlorobium phaeovibrioides]HCD36626.1 iron-sulfur cluster assembly scaffold protein [Chlorobium sp.]KAA6231945.1 iron-sulfur cluster assembly scaffold protein [Chlorobium phaeovibrioides]MWV53570.1 iron-sulfur cluster assembly scaffold protein [Chlorobium phaeovibrioides]QEQ57499.1 iron-sulfur cluster assembly scaffold protein [Chlorobium phaeovibrioides]RTY36127.1 iron-sulfur cluster assembly scaffold protein [Chlorobium phaeovibrioides]
MLQAGEWAYSETLKEHFMNPKNIMQGEDTDAFDGVGMEGNLQCGDQMMVVIKVDGGKQVITDCQWKTYGCASAIASTSILSEMVKGMTLEQAFNVSPKDVAKELGGLPDNKIHCSVLGDKALRAAINNYYVRNGMEDKVMEEKAKIVCQCMSITDHDIEEAVLEGARTYFELQERTKLGTVCGQCKDEAESLLDKFKHLHFGA